MKKKIKLLNDVPSKKTGNPKNILNTIKFIIGTDYLNASVIKLDGGI